MNFKLNNTADINGTSLKGYFRAKCSDLIKVFGEPEDYDDYKVSTTWRFESDTGEVFSLYDYKMTSLYDPSYLSPNEFRNGGEYEWHIGGRTSPEKFIEFLNSKIKANINTELLDALVNLVERPNDVNCRDNAIFAILKANGGIQ